MQQLFLKQIDSECSQLCSSKSPSCIRSPKVRDMKNFSFKKFDEELKTKAPQLSAVLKTARLRKSKREKHDAFWLPSVCMSAAVLLKKKIAVYEFTSAYEYYYYLSQWNNCEYKSVFVLCIGSIAILSCIK